MRNQVEIAAAAGLSHNQIASALGIAKQTLETHFASELRDGRTRKLIAVLCLLDKAAKRGSVAAMKYLANNFSNGAPVRLGKKELQKREAEIALANSVREFVESHSKSLRPRTRRSRQKSRGWKLHSKRALA
jgi:hypothetical protein